MITRFAGRDEVVPGVRTTTGARNDVIDRQISALLAAILAGVIVANEDFAPGQFDARSWTLDEIDEANHSRRFELSRRRADHRVVNLENLCFAVDDEDDGTPDVTDVERL